MFYEEFLFLDETSNAESSVYKVSQGEQITLQVCPLDESVTGTTLNVLGQVDTKLDSSEDISWAKIACINMSDYSTKESIEEVGIYCVGVSGIKRIKVTNGDSAQYGKVKVYGIIS